MRLTKNGTFRILSILLTPIAAAVLMRNGLFSQSPSVERPAAVTIYSTRVMTSPTTKPRTLRLIEARREDGSSVAVNVAVDESGSERASRFITIPSERKRITVVDRFKHKSTQFLTPSQLDRIAYTHISPICADAPGGRDRGEAFSGWKDIADIPAALYTEDTPHWKAEYYYAPSLNCASVKRVHELKDDKGNLNGTKTVEEITTVILGEPPASLFAIPTDYSEVSPSQLRSALWKAQNSDNPNLPAPECLNRAGQKADEVYFK